MPMITYRTLPFVAAMLLALGMTSLPASVTAQEFAIDPTHSQARVTWSHAGFSNPGAAFQIGEGRLVFDEAEPAHSSVEVRIPVASVHTQVPALDEIFLTQYFKVAEHPAITFASKRVGQIDNTGHYRVEGTLSINGISRPVTLEATLNRVGVHPLLEAPAIGFEASTTLKRSEFGLDAYIPVVGDEITVHLTVEAIDPEALAMMMAEGD